MSNGGDKTTKESKVDSQKGKASDKATDQPKKDEKDKK
jgi:hypothetical protein